MMYDLYIAVSKEYEILRKDDQLLLDFLNQNGIKTKVVVWDDNDIDWNNTKAVLITSAWDYTWKIKEFLKWVSSVSSKILLLNSKEIIYDNYDKNYLFKLNKQGINIPKTVLITSIADYMNLSSSFTEDIVIKPVIGAGGRNTYKIKKNNINLVEQLLNSHHSILVQEYLYSIETEGEFSTILIDLKHVHTIQKRASIGEFRIQSHYKGTEDLLDELNQKQSEFINQLIDLVPSDALYARIDYCKDNQGNYALMELEMIEPSLFIEHNLSSLPTILLAIKKRLGGFDDARYNTFR